MYDETQEPPELKKKPEASPFAWKSLPMEDLLRYYSEIRELLPPLSIDKLNLEEEMLLQLHTMQTLQRKVLDDEGFPLNQRVQVANNVATSLARLAELQKEVYSSERFKRIEGLILRTFRGQPEELCEAFLTQYREKIAEIR